MLSTGRGKNHLLKVIYTSTKYYCCTLLVRSRGGCIVMA